MFERITSILALVVSTFALFVALDNVDTPDEPIGVCVGTDTSTVLTSIMTPTSKNDVVSCEFGSFVSVIPSKAK